jgi:hypothetical protein
VQAISRSGRPAASSRSAARFRVHGVPLRWVSRIELWRSAVHAPAPLTQPALDSGRPRRTPDPIQMGEGALVT